ncbi:MAG: arylesterase [Pseudobdellovibrionaceae bacterium]
MRLFLFVTLLFFGSVSFSQSSVQPSLASNSKKLVVLGDSLTEGLGVSKESAYPALLEKKIHDSGKNWIVINAGVSGSTTASIGGRLKWLFKSKPDLLLIVMGANDGLRGLKIEDSEKNLSQAIEFAQEQKVPVVLGGLYIPPNYGKDYTEKFKKMYTTLAKKYKIPLIPFVLDKVAGNPKYNQADGIHPNEAGHKIIAETVYQEIKGLL